MKKTYLLSLMLIFLIVFTQSCVKEEVVWPACQIEKMTVINLNIGDSQEISTKSSVATSNERTISDAYILLFLGNQYVTGEKVNLSSITNNGSQTPYITTKLPILTSYTVMILLNTGCTFSTIPIVEGAVFTNPDNAINEAFPSTTWNMNRIGSDSGKGLPMSGRSPVNADGTIPTIDIYRSVAKIQLFLDLPNAAADVTGSFTSASDAVKWGLFNEVQEGGIVSAQYYPNIPSSITFDSDSPTSLPQRLVGSSGATDDQQTRYTCEYLCQDKAKTATVESYYFHPDRTCLIVHTSAGFYRLDILKPYIYSGYNIRNHINIIRDTHYKIFINKVKSYGYPTVEEALNNYASNIEYEIQIADLDTKFMTSNGQYAIATDISEINVSNNITTPTNLVKFSCIFFSFLDSTWPIINNVVTRTVSLVGADKNTPIPTSQIQMCKSDGTAITGNFTTYTSEDESGYQLQYTSGSSLPTQQMYVKICYGNVIHYVPIVK